MQSSTDLSLGIDLDISSSEFFTCVGLTVVVTRYLVWSGLVGPVLKGLEPFKTLKPKCWDWIDIWTTWLLERVPLGNDSYPVGSTVAAAGGVLGVVSLQYFHNTRNSGTKERVFKAEILLCRQKGGSRIARPIISKETILLLMGQPTNISSW